MYVCIYIYIYTCIIWVILDIWVSIDIFIYVSRYLGN